MQKEDLVKILTKHCKNVDEFYDFSFNKFVKPPIFEIYEDENLCLSECICISDVEDNIHKILYNDANILEGWRIFYVVNPNGGKIYYLDCETLKYVQFNNIKQFEYIIKKLKEGVWIEDIKN